MSNDHELPEYYIADNGDRVSQPVYLLLSDCFLGKPGGPPAKWEGGTELQTDLTPNDEMKPLNRAAGERVNRWRASLPIMSGRVEERDLAEAAALLAPREGEQIQPHEIWWAGVIRLAGELRMKRQGAHVPAPSSYIQRVTDRAAPPMSAGDFKDVAHRGQETTGMKAHDQLAAKRLQRKPAPPMATEPKPPAGDATNT